MPGIYSIVNTIAEEIEKACYPSGTSNPSITGKQITIQGGYPIRTQLDKDLQSGFSHIRVYPDSKQRPITKFERIYIPLEKSEQTIFAEVLNNTVTITGTISIPQTLMIITNGVGYAYAIQSSDNLNSIASSIASLIPDATAENNVITVLNSYKLIARVSVKYTAGRELSRMEGIFNIEIYSPNPFDRAVICDAVNNYLQINYRIVGSDDFYILFSYNNMKTNDMLEKEGIYSIMLFYMVNYPNTEVKDFMSITHPFVNSIEVKWQ